MSERPDPHAGESMVGPHGEVADHGDHDGNDDHAAHGGDALGPFDIRMWGAALLGVVLGLVVALAFAQSVG